MPVAKTNCQLSEEELNISVFHSHCWTKSASFPSLKNYYLCVKFDSNENYDGNILFLKLFVLGFVPQYYIRLSVSLCCLVYITRFNPFTDEKWNNFINIHVLWRDRRHNCSFVKWDNGYNSCRPIKTENVEPLTYQENRYDHETFIATAEKLFRK